MLRQFKHVFKHWLWAVEFELPEETTARAGDYLAMSVSLLTCLRLTTQMLLTASLIILLVMFIGFWPILNFQANNRWFDRSITAFFSLQYTIRSFYHPSVRPPFQWTNPSVWQMFLAVMLSYLSRPQPEISVAWLMRRLRTLRVRFWKV